MDCQKHQQRLTEYIDDRLPEAREAALEEHLSECPDCRRELKMLRRTVDAVSDVPRQRAPAGLTEGVMDSIEATAVAGGAGAERAKIISLAPWFAGVAAAFLMALGLAFLMAPPLPPEDRAPARMAALSRPRRGAETLAQEKESAGRRMDRAAGIQAEGTPRDTVPQRREAPSAPGGYGAGSAGSRLSYGFGGYSGGYGGGYGVRGYSRSAVGGPRSDVDGAQGELRRARQVAPDASRPAERLSREALGKLQGQMQGHVETDLASRAALFNQMDSNRAPLELAHEKPDRVVTLVAGQPITAVRRVVQVANSRRIGVQIRLPMDGPEGEQAEVAMKVPEEIYTTLLQEIADSLGLRSALTRGLTESTRFFAMKGEVTPPEVAGQKAEKKAQAGEEEAQRLAEDAVVKDKTRAAPDRPKERADTLQAPALRVKKKGINLLVRVVRPSDKDISETGPADETEPTEK